MLIIFFNSFAIALYLHKGAVLAGMIVNTDPAKFENRYIYIDHNENTKQKHYHHKIR